MSDTKRHAAPSGCTSVSQMPNITEHFVRRAFPQVDDRQRTTRSAALLRANFERSVGGNAMSHTNNKPRAVVAADGQLTRETYVFKQTQGGAAVLSPP